MSELKTITISKWHSPVSDYHNITVGSARLRTTYYLGNKTYNAWGQRGIKYFEVPKGKKLPIRQLQIKEKNRWNTWMVDDPPHCWAMEDYAMSRFTKGKVLIAGLGLGLILHYLKQNHNVTEATIIERNPDVIKLIYTPQMHLSFFPKFPPKIIEDDFWEFIKTDTNTYDRIIIDLYTTSNGREWKNVLMKEVLPGFEKVVAKYGIDYPPKPSIIVHGFGTIPNLAYQYSRTSGHTIQEMAERLI